MNCFAQKKFWNISSINFLSILLVECVGWGWKSSPEGRKIYTTYHNKLFQNKIYREFILDIYSILWLIFMTHLTFQLMTSMIFPREVRLLHQHRKRIQFCHIRSVPLGILLIKILESGWGPLRSLFTCFRSCKRSYKILQDRKVLLYLFWFLKNFWNLKNF